jgi:glutamate-1-semialdehyde aminotransferase
VNSISRVTAWKFFLSTAHTEADIDQHLAAFADIADSLAAAQHERTGAVATH